MHIDNSKNCTESEKIPRLSEIINFSLLLKYNKINQRGATQALVFEKHRPLLVRQQLISC